MKLAVEKKFPYIVDVLLQGEITAKSDLNLDDRNGATPLMYAAAKGDLEMVRHLLTKKNIQVDRRDKVKMTALLYAAKSGHWDVFDELLAHGANVALKSEDNKTVLDYVSDPKRIRNDRERNEKMNKIAKKVVGKWEKHEAFIHDVLSNQDIDVIKAFAEQKDLNKEDLINILRLVCIFLVKLVCLLIYFLKTL